MIVFTLKCENPPAQDQRGFCSCLFLAAIFSTYLFLLVPSPILPSLMLCWAPQLAPPLPVHPTAHSCPSMILLVLSTAKASSLFLFPSLRCSAMFLLLSPLPSSPGLLPRFLASDLFYLLSCPAHSQVVLGRGQEARGRTPLTTRALSSRFRGQSSDQRGPFRNQLGRSETASQAGLRGHIVP